MTQLIQTLLGVVAAMVLLGSCVLAAQDNLVASDLRIREDVVRWLGRLDKDATLVDPVVYGPAALPAIREVLQSAEAKSEVEISRALILLQRVGASPTEVSSLARPLLAATDADVRYEATDAIAAAGDAGDAIALMAMMYDSDASVRYTALRGLGRIANVNDIVLLQIWRQRASGDDARRPPEQKWLTPEVERLYADVVEQIKGKGKGE